MNSNYSKRVLDILIASIGLVFIWPIVVIISILILFSLGSPILFTQMRLGLNGMHFKIYKFRTMTNKRNSQGILLSDSMRLTKLGRFLRSISLDELPELLNVIKGDMSIVGPRPLLIQYLDRYKPEQARRHEVKPGITGWAQVNGRNAISWEEKFKLDVWYVDNKTIRLDLKILFFTILRVLERRGINQPGHATSEEFMGTA